MLNFIFSLLARTSLKLEPNETELRNSKAKLYSGGRFTSQYDIHSSHFYINEYDATFDVKTARNMLNKSLNEELFYQTKYQLKQEAQMQQQQQQNLGVPFKPGHRKTNSLEVNNILAMGKNNSLGNSSSCHSNSSNGSSRRKNLKMNLIDDSPSYDIFLCSLNRCDMRKPSLELQLKNKSMHSFPLDSTGSFSTSNTDDAETNSLEDVSDSLRNSKLLTYSHSELVHTGYISRKTVLKVGKKPSVGGQSL